MDIKQKLNKNLQENVDLTQYSTFKIGGPAKYFFIAKTNEDIVKAAQTAKKNNLPFFILGGGSNVLISDKGFNGLVIKAENKSVNAKKNIIKAEAGALLEQVVFLATEDSLSGLEWAAGIPGTVGGATRGNAGAFGASMSNNLKSIKAYNIRGDKILEMPKQKCEFGYRESVFKKDNNLIILEAEFELQAGDKEGIKKKIGKYLGHRCTSQPDLKKFPSAGCSFKNIITTDEIRKKVQEINPDGLEKIRGNELGAAWFIDQCG